MTPHEIEIMKKEIANAVKITVNGKIDAVQKSVDANAAKHEADMADLRPIIQAIGGGRVIGNVFKWLAGLAILYFALKGVLIKVI